ncbi:MAG: hypothetical protein B6241_10045 [Spirochaetaceae bacterium 4572_59]|nr:MAG: hypothetical protein B6241_10045 [Spirochaetaceae bacterium 4572_59]
MFGDVSKGMDISLQIIRTLSEFLLVFSIGSGVGWWLEFSYRGIIRKGDFINPGFLSGPYLPIYGFGAYFLYLLDGLPLSFLQKVLFFTIAATLMELFTGLFFVRFFKIRLWDYSMRKGNIKGQICPLFTFYWMMAGGIGLYLIVPFLKEWVSLFSERIHLTFFLGLYYGIILSDVVNSFNMATRLSSIVSGLKEKGRPLVLDYKKLRRHLRDVQSYIPGRGFLGRFLIPFNNISRHDLEDHLDSFIVRLKEYRIIKKAASHKEKQP